MSWLEYLILAVIAAVGYAVVSAVFNLARRRRRQPPTPPTAAPPDAAALVRVCPHADCHQANLSSARFCRWCGRDMG